MTGLDIERDKIMEVACLITDSDLNIIAEGPDIIIHQPKSLLDNMDTWCTNQHGKVTKYRINKTYALRTNFLIQDRFRLD